MCVRSFRLDEVLAGEAQWGLCHPHSPHSFFLFGGFLFTKNYSCMCVFWQLAFYFLLASPFSPHKSGFGLLGPNWTTHEIERQPRELVFAIYYKIASIIALESRRKEISIKPLDVVDASCWFFLSPPLFSLNTWTKWPSYPASCLSLSHSQGPLCFHELQTAVLSNVKNYLDCSGKWNEPSCFIFTHFPVAITKFSTFFFSFPSLYTMYCGKCHQCKIDPQPYFLSLPEISSKFAPILTRNREPKV